MNFANLYIRIVLIQIIITLAASCSTDKAPTLIVKYTIDGLQITLTGSAFKNDAAVSEISIDWGDGNGIKVQKDNFDSFEKTHVFSDPDTYIVTVVATDLNGKSTSESLNISVYFAEVTLDKIKKSMFKTSDDEYLILTLNMHTYQEDMQNEKINTITEVIGKMDIDFITFQECAQNKSATITNGIVREDNMALIIADKLKADFNKEYSFVWDWAHYGWNVWEEGVAVLSKHPLTDSESKYISSNVSTTNIASRKAIYGSYQIQEDQFNIFSVHTHWRTSETDNEQKNQITNIQKMVDEKNLVNQSIITIVCGDLNVNPTSDYPWSEGYYTMINNDYLDTFLEVYPDANSKPANSIYNTVGGTYPGRIDYIFIKNTNQVKVVDSQIIFNDNVIGKVSDHNGVLTKISVN